MRRNYANAPARVKELYAKQRANQCLCYVKRMHEKYDPGNAEPFEMSAWQAIEALGQLIDQSDPDVTIPNDQHAFQTAEGLRTSGAPEWLQLCGLIHDMGKVLYLKGCTKDGTSPDSQYGVVGDTLVVGYPRSEKLVFPELNHRMMCQCEQDEETPWLGQGFDSYHFSYGHDEYLWRVLQHNHRIGRLRFARDLPHLFCYIIRYHSFYAWHASGAYAELANLWDEHALPWLQRFSHFDLYTKSDDDSQDVDKLKTSYDGLMRRWLGCGIDDLLIW